MAGDDVFPQVGTHLESQNQATHDYKFEDLHAILEGGYVRARHQTLLRQILTGAIDHRSRSLIAPYVFFVTE